MKTFSKKHSIVIFLIIILALSLQPVLPVVASPAVPGKNIDEISGQSTNPLTEPTIRYVSILGSDTNTCTLDAPCQTLRKALELAANGDTIKITEDIYFSEDININKGVTISGGWDYSFDIQGGYSVVNSRSIYNNSTATIERFAVRNNVNNYRSGLINNMSGNLTLKNCEIDNNSGSGIRNYGTLVVDQCSIHNNSTYESGGGINNSGTLTVTNSNIYSNSTMSSGSGGGVGGTNGSIVITNSYIYWNRSNWGGGGVYGENITITNSALFENFAQMSGGAIWSDSVVNINNSTLANNTAGQGGGAIGVPTVSMITLNNVTVAGNHAAEGGAIKSSGGTIILKNSIVANNTAVQGDNCGPTSYAQTDGYTIIYPISCGLGGISPDPKLGQLVPGPQNGYVPIAADSPAINAGNPATCFGTTDQRGMPRVGICDLGSYEYIPPSQPASIQIVSGDRQRVVPGSNFDKPFKVIVLDQNNTPVGSGYDVTFTASPSGPSGTFSATGSNISIVKTDSSGYASSPILRANSQIGEYTIQAYIAGGASVQFTVGNGFWAISPSGDDINDCLSLLTPCLSIPGVMAKTKYYDGDTIRIETGTYSPSMTLPVNIKQSARISGGWNSTFTAQNGISVFQRDFKIFSPHNVSLDNIIIDGIGLTGGLVNEGKLLLQNSAVINGTSGIINNNGQLTIVNTTISGNSSGSTGGGLWNSGANAKVVIINSTISSNTAGQGGGILNDSGSGATIDIYSSTITNNTATDWGSGGIDAFGGVIIRNTIIAGNNAPPGSNYAPDCRGYFTSNGNNIIGNIGDFDPINSHFTCYTEFKGNDKVGTNTLPIPVESILGPLTDIGNGIGIYPLIASSPAIDNGNPLAPGTPNSDSCPLSDQRGLIRPQGSRCDIGAYEYGTEPGIFFDVPQNHWAWQYIEKIYHAGITGGCETTPFKYCPDSVVTRAQMAIFLERGIHGGTFNPPMVPITFSDTSGHWAQYWIEALKNDGITSGCGAGVFCPEIAVTRDQMAVFLLRAKYGLEYIPPAVGSGTGFNDVPADYWAAAWIKQLAAEGITGGCGNGIYCPTAAITRAQMAVFLVRAFNLP